MINIEIICIGKIKEKSLSALCDEYLKRLSKYSKVTITELADESLNKVSSISEEEKIKDIEAEKILNRIEKISKPYIIALDLNGKMYDSNEFSNKIQNIATYEASNIVFIIGGSLGIANNLLNKANEKISFSKMTFPHQLFRVFLLEQIYRGFKIQNNEAYHK